MDGRVKQAQDQLRKPAFVPAVKTRSPQCQVEWRHTSPSPFPALCRSVSAGISRHFVILFLCQWPASRVVWHPTMPCTLIDFETNFCTTSCSLQRVFTIILVSPSVVQKSDLPNGGKKTKDISLTVVLWPQIPCWQDIMWCVSSLRLSLLLYLQHIKVDKQSYEWGERDFASEFT